jgi:hypothetical protein
MRLSSSPQTNDNVHFSSSTIAGKGKSRRRLKLLLYLGGLSNPNSRPERQFFLTRAKVHFWAGGF